MLRNKFWSGLAVSHIKSSLRHKFDADEDYASLLVAARTVEEEEFSPPKHKTTKVLHQQSASDPSTRVESKLDEMLKHIKSLEVRIHNLEDKSTDKSQHTVKSQHRSTDTGYCYECGDSSHYRNECPILGRGPAGQHSQDHERTNHNRQQRKTQASHTAQNRSQTTQSSKNQSQTSRVHLNSR
jgi:hypothetical protein